MYSLSPRGAAPCLSIGRQRVITNSPGKSCSLDPLPTWLLKLCLEPLLPTLTHLTNCALLGGMPAAYKKALLSPLLKKPTLDRNVINNYRPVSNLPFLSKVLERIVARRLQDHLRWNKCLILSSQRTGPITPVRRLLLMSSLSFSRRWINKK